MRYVARFVPQVWINDTAVSVDPQGPTVWDATEYVEAFLHEPDGTYTPESAALWLEATLEHGDHDDHLRTDPNAPAWVREWSGPFDTYLFAEEGDLLIKIKVVMTGHHEDRGRDTMCLVFANEESESEIVRAMAELYYLNENCAGDPTALPDDLTWEWLADRIENYAWWTIDEREIVIDTKRDSHVRSE